MPTHLLSRAWWQDISSTMALPGMEHIIVEVRVLVKSPRSRVHLKAARAEMNEQKS